MKTKPIPQSLAASDFQRWVASKKGWTLETAIEFCRDGNHREYCKLFAEWQRETAMQSEPQ
jgi:hypothetical protein